jgi:hypothetical protein
LLIEYMTVTKTAEFSGSDCMLNIIHYLKNKDFVNFEIIEALEIYRLEPESYFLYTYIMQI